MGAAGTLPRGLRVRLARDTVVTGNAAVLIGGSPLTVLRLAPAARIHLRDRTVVVVDAASAHLADRLLATNLAQPELSGAPQAHPDDITVVIPVRDRPHELDRALATLTGLRCIVVDDASTAPDRIAAVTTAHGATLIKLPRNLGPAATRNAGLDRVTTPYTAFVDSDVEVDAETLLRLSRHFIDPSVVLLGPLVMGRSLHARPRWFQKYDAVASSLTLGDTPAVVRPRSAVGWLPSACLLGRTTVLREDMGGFDTAMRVGEDVDLVWRLAESGHRVRYDPIAEAFHSTRATFSAWLGRKFVYGTSGAPLGARHGAAIAPAVLSPVYALAAAALLTRRRWSLPLALACAGIGARTVRQHLPGGHRNDLTAARIAVRGLGWAVRQESSLLLRHWWPLTLIALRHPEARRATATALAVDIAVGAWELRHRRQLSPLTVIIARRFDDLAYGAGLWYGAAKARSAAPLIPRRR